MLRSPALLAFLCALLCGLSFTPALAGGFVLDDVPLIAQNPHNQSFDTWRIWFGGGMWDLAQEASLTAEHHGFFRPLVLATYAADWLTGAGAPLQFHVTNVVLHGLVVVLAFLLARRALGSPWLAALCALGFGLHPAKAENVAWISGRTDLLCSLGILLAAFGIAERLRGRRAGLVIEGVGTVAAYLSKESAVVLPVIALFEVGVVVLQSRAGSPGVFSRDVFWRTLSRWLFWAPQAAIATIYLGARSLVFPLRGEVSGLTAADHARYVFETAGRAAELLFFPRDLSYYAASVRRTPEGLVHALGYEALGAGFLGALLLGAWWCRRRLPMASLACVAFAGVALPISNLVFVGEAELLGPRLLYLPELFVSLALVGLLAQVRLSLALGCLLLGGFFVRTWMRSEDFSSQARFSAYELRQNPDVPEAVLGAMAQDRAAGESTLGMLRGVCGFARAREQFVHRPSAGEFIFQTLGFADRVMADMPPEALLGVAGFLEIAADGKDTARLERPFAIDVPPGGKVSEGLVQRAGGARVLAARFAARGGKPEWAAQLLARARSGCPGCSDVLAQAERAEELIVLVPPPEDLRQAELSVGPLTQRGLFGRALLSLAPYLREIVERGPESAEGLARLARLAGDERLFLEIVERLPEARRRLVLKETEIKRGDYDPRTHGSFLTGGCALAAEL